jgi:uncharacterized phage-associated protein
MQKTALTVIQAILYLLKSHPVLNKIQIIKLLYLADKQHLVHYGRTVTGDEYWAMRMGPVGSAAKDVLSIDENRPNKLSGDILVYAKNHLDEFENSYRSKNRKCEFEMLSDSDKQALDFVVSRFGSMGPFELRDYTHKYPEWKKHESFFKDNPGQRKRIPQQELFSVIDVQLGITKEDASKARELFADC